MSYLPELRGSLVRAAERRTEVARRATEPMHRPRLSGAFALALSAVLTAAVAAAVLLAAGHGGGGAPASRPASSSRSQLIATLGVLRRPQTAAEHAFVHRGWPQPAGGRRARVALDRSLTRLATTTAWGAPVYLVALRPPADRRLARSLGETLAVWVRGIGWSDLATVAEIRDGAAWGPLGTTESSGARQISRFFEVVPDGVASVVFYNLVGGGRSHARLGRLGRKITALVHGNVATFNDPGFGAREVLAKWYASGGRLIRRVGDWSVLAGGAGTASVAVKRPR